VAIAYKLFLRFFYNIYNTAFLPILLFCNRNIFSNLTGPSCEQLHKILDQQIQDPEKNQVFPDNETMKIGM
jgi:hypothetical protein